MTIYYTWFPYIDGNYFSAHPQIVRKINKNDQLIGIPGKLIRQTSFSPGLDKALTFTTVTMRIMQIMSNSAATVRAAMVIWGDVRWLRNPLASGSRNVDAVWPKAPKAPTPSWLSACSAPICIRLFPAGDEFMQPPGKSTAKIQHLIFTHTKTKILYFVLNLVRWKHHLLLVHLQ